MAYKSLAQQVPDGGQFYTETNLAAFIVEPWNAASAFVFLGIAIFWWYKLKGKYTRYSFLTSAIGLLTIGAIGGTLYHAFRSSPVFLYMDWLPILILCIMTSIYFLEKITGKIFLALALVLAVLLLQGLLYRFVDSRNAINLNYAVMGALVLLPTILVLKRYNFYEWRYVSFALISFSLALFFRISDGWGLLPVGTHFLWHVFGAVAGNFMFHFIYRLNKLELKTLKLRKSQNRQKK